MIISQSITQRTQKIWDDGNEIDWLIPSPSGDTSGQRQIGHSQSLPRHLIRNLIRNLSTYQVGGRDGWIQLGKFFFCARVCGLRRSSQWQCKIRLIMPARGASHVIKSIIIWLAPRAGKVKQIARCDWLPERARWSHLVRSGLPAVYPACKISPKAL